MIRSGSRLLAVPCVALALGLLVATPAGPPDGDRSGAPRPRRGDAWAQRRPAPLPVRTDAPSSAPGPHDAAADPRRARPTLDEAGVARIAEHLGRVIVRARTERGAYVASSILPRLLDEGEVRILVGHSPHTGYLEPRLRGTRHEVDRYYRVIPFAALTVGPEALRTLVESPDVESIEEDRRSYPTLAESTVIIGSSLARKDGYDGTGWTIVVLDTGVDLDHPFFADRIVDEACFSINSNCPNGATQMLGPGAGASCDFSAQDCGHGTAVAGIALGSDASQPLAGVAPGASLISIQVFSDENGRASAWTSDVVAGLERAFELRAFYSIAAVNMSFGGEGVPTEAECDLDNAARKAIVDQLRAVGIVSIASSGNDGSTDQIGPPACISSVIAVGATTKNDEIPSFSNSASFLSLLAPGSSILTAGVGGGYGYASGTSMAAPHVAGAFAQMRHASPTSSASEVLFALQTTGPAITDSRNGVTTRRIDIQAATNLLFSGTVDIDEKPIGVDAEASGAACGLVGLEPLAPLVWAVWRRRRGSGRR